MKTVLLLIVVVVVAIHADPIKPKLRIPQSTIERLRNLKRSDSKDGIELEIDQLVDDILVTVDQFIIDSGLDPYQLSEIHEGFNETFLFIEYHGELDLTNGWLQDISTLKRDGPSTIVIGDILKVTVPVAFDDLVFQYDYNAKFMGLGPKGLVDGKVSDVKAAISLEIDLTTFHITLDTLDISNSGNISIRFSENNDLLDFLVNIFTGLVTFVLHDLILGIVDLIIVSQVNNVIDQINNMLDGGGSLVL